MPRLFAVKSALLAALGAAVLLVSPATALAATAAPAAITHPQAVDGGGSGLTTSFTGITYPDTSAGLSACQAQGNYIVTDPGSHTIGYQCPLGDPDAGVYNLWTTWYPNNYCFTCLRRI